MEVKLILVDELPISCKECFFCLPDYGYNTGSCKALKDNEVSTIMNCTHKDCPLINKEQFDDFYLNKPY